jgi:hypothetical protein
MQANALRAAPAAPTLYAMTKLSQWLRTCSAALGLAAFGALASAGAAGAATIGANAPISTGACAITADTGQGDIWFDKSYAVSSAGGRITSFAFQNDGLNAGNALDFVVLRDVGADRWAVVGRTGLNALGADSALDVFTPPSPILVAPGDVIGFFFPSVDDTVGAAIHGCFLTTAGATNVATSPDFLDPAVGTVVTEDDSFSVPRNLNVSASVDESLVPDISGGGDNSGRPVNTFTVSALSTSGSGTLTYSDPVSGRVFNGVIDCVNRVGNAATIVAHDPATGYKNRTTLQDGGTTGDKIFGTGWNPATHSAKFNARTSTCVAPDTARLARRAALPGDEIHITG